MAYVSKSRVIPAPMEQVWNRVRDFNGLPTWHPAISESHIEGGRVADAVGCVRHLTLADGAEIREQLVALSDEECGYQYRILESPLPISDYLASLTLRPVTHGDETYVEWGARFEVGAEDEAKLREVLGEGVFKAGLDSLVQLFG